MDRLDKNEILCYSIKLVRGFMEKHIFFGLNGTLVPNYTEEEKFSAFLYAVDNILDPNEIMGAYNLFSKMSGNYIRKFISECEKHNGYGNIVNFAWFLKRLNFFYGKEFDIYMIFLMKYFSYINDLAGKKVLFDKTREMLDKLKDEGYQLYLYDNVFSKEAAIKLRENGIENYFNKKYTIDYVYAKSTKGWEYILSENNIDSEQNLVMMVGDSSTDIPTKKTGVLSITVNHNGRLFSDGIASKSLIIPSFDYIIDPDFTSNMEKRKLKVM